MRRYKPDYGSSRTGKKVKVHVCRNVKGKPTVQIQYRTEDEVSRVLVKFGCYV
jgi:hypothetical protein